MKNLRDTIFENLDHALENGQFEEGGDLLGKSKLQIAEDMKDCTTLKAKIRDMVPYIEAWFISRADKLEGERS